MRHCVAKFALASIVVVAFAGSVAAQGRGPNSLQPDTSAVFVTFILRHDSIPARGNVLILPSPHRPAPLGKPSKGGGGGGGGTGGGGGGTTGGPSSISLGSSTYTPGLTITPTTTQPEAEEEITADPSDSAGNNLVAAISDFSSASGFNNTKWVLSTNGGGAWTENFVPNDPSTGLLLTSDGRSWDANSDPVLAFDRSGNVFLSDLYINVDPSTGAITGEGFYVSVDTFSHLGAGNFGHTNPVLVNPNNAKTFNIEDKPWITVDNSASSRQGTVYVSWSHFTGCQNKFDPLVGAYVLTCTSDVIYLAYSTNHGQTWSAPIQISAGGQSGAVQGSQPAVGPDGKVYLTYEFFGSGNQRQQFLSVGTWSNGSLTFSAPFIVTPVFNDLTFAGCSTCTASYRVNSFPNIAVGPATGTNSSGNVYLVYGGQATSTSPANVYFVACTAGCTSPSAFNAPAIINDTSTPAEHFFPAIAVDASGVIHTSWFDTRNSDNPITDPDIFDIYASFLTYTGSNSFTLSPNDRVTQPSINASFVAGFGDTSFIGDYAGIAATAESKAHAHPVWTNTSGILGLILTGSLQTATLSLP